MKQRRKGYKEYLFILLFILFSYFGEANHMSIYSEKDYIALAKYYEKAGDLKNVLYNYEKAIECNLYSVEANLFFIKEAEKQKNYENLLKHFQLLGSVSEKKYSILFNTAYILNNYLCRIDEAIEVYKRVLEIAPDNPNVHLCLSRAYLLSGKFIEACKEQEAIDIINNTEIDRLWDGSLLTNKTILIKDDKGIGDVFMWLRYARDFKARG